MKKPRMKCGKPKIKGLGAFAVMTTCPTQYYLSFYANDTVAECAKEFGCVRPFDNQAGKWAMDVDGRYDFVEVVAWLESFN